MAKITDFILNQFKKHPLRTCLFAGGIAGGTVAALILFSVFPPLGIAGLSIAGVGIGSATAITALNFALTPFIATFSSGLFSLAASFMARKLTNKTVPAINGSKPEDNQTTTVNYKIIDNGQMYSKNSVEIKASEPITVGQLKKKVSEDTNIPYNQLRFYNQVPKFNDGDDSKCDASDDEIKSVKSGYNTFVVDRPNC